jgi:endonuclease III
MARSTNKDLAGRLMKIAGTTYAEEAGITLRDAPMPLFQLLVLCMLASKPIDATIAVAAARELFGAGLKTPKSVLSADRDTMIEAFGRAHYARYDESSATRLADMAAAVRDEYSGDLRGMADTHDIGEVTRLLKQFKGIGDTGADIFLREVQEVWVWVAPHFDRRATAAARDIGLPADPDRLGALAPGKTAKLAAALVRVSLDDDLRARLVA